MHRPLLTIVLLIFCGIRPALSLENSLWSELTQSQKEQLVSGGSLKLEEDVPDSAWPRFRIYHLVNGKPSDVAAVFWNCELDPAYIPNCTSVRILSRPSPSIHEAEYTLKMPFFLPDEVYVSRNSLREISPSDYEISWKVLSSRYTKSCTGNLRMEQYGNRTLIRYTNLVVPGSRIARLLRASAGNQVVDSVHALVHQVGSELSNDGRLLEQQLGELEKSLHPAR
jgi:hypothetical protein